MPINRVIIEDAAFSIITLLSLLIVTKLFLMISMLNQKVTSDNKKRVLKLYEIRAWKVTCTFKINET